MPFAHNMQHRLYHELKAPTIKVLKQKSLPPSFQLKFGSIPKYFKNNFIISIRSQLAKFCQFFYQLTIVDDLPVLLLILGFGPQIFQLQTSVFALRSSLKPKTPETKCCKPLKVGMEEAC